MQTTNKSIPNRRDIEIYQPNQPTYVVRKKRINKQSVIKEKTKMLKNDAFVKIKLEKKYYVRTIARSKKKIRNKICFVI